MDILPAISQGIARHRPEEVPPVVPPQDWTLVREWLRSKRSPGTRKVYTRNISAFYAFCDGASLDSISLTMLQDYEAELLRRYPEPATRAQMLAAVKSLMTFGMKTGKLAFNVGAALQLPQGKDKLAERILDARQLHKMLDEAEKGSTRDYTLLLLLYGSGIRCSELCGLQWKDVQENRNGGQITVYGKRSKTRSILLHPKVWQPLQAYRPDDASPDDYVFSSRQLSTRDGRPSKRLTTSRVWQIVSGIARRAGVKASPHFLRHTHATRALENHVPPHLLMESLGHSSLVMVGHYAHARPDDSSSQYLDL